MSLSLQSLDLKALASDFQSFCQAFPLFPAQADLNFQVFSHLVLIKQWPEVRLVPLPRISAYSIVGKYAVTASELVILPVPSQCSITMPG
jgi:hypothetical protein